jgi:hypothetical protein
MVERGPVRRLTRATRPIEASKASIRHVCFAWTRDIQSLATNVRNPPQLCEAYIDW